MPPKPFRPLTQEDAAEAFDLHTAAVGRVAAAWNTLHEQLEYLFWHILGQHDYLVTSAVWYSSYSDRSQRQMLEAAINASTNHPAWKRLPASAKEDLIYIMKRINYLGDKRDEAVHAPCTWLQTSWEETEVTVNQTSKHRRAKSLIGKDLLVEFDWLERYIYILSEFTQRAAFALNTNAPAVVQPSPWPEKPHAPDRRPKTLLRGRLRQPSPESQSPPPQSSRQ